MFLLQSQANVVNILKSQFIIIYIFTLLIIQFLVSILWQSE